LRRDLAAASDAHRHIAKQSQRLTQGKKLAQCKIVHAYDPTIAPIMKGKSHCPAQFGRKTGLLSEPASGFIFANRVPHGNPSDPSYVLPLLDKVQQAIDLVASPQRLRVYSLGGDLGSMMSHCATRCTGRGILTVGIPTTVEPINPTPSQQEVRDILNGRASTVSGPPHQSAPCLMPVAYSRPVVESHIATLMSRRCGPLHYKGSEGAVVQMGMIVMAHNGAVLVRSVSSACQNGAKIPPIARLRRRNINQNNDSKN